GAALDATAFVAPEPEALSFYAYRRGIDWADRGRPLPWSEFLTLADGRHARAYVLPSKREDSGIAETSAETTLARARDWLPRARGREPFGPAAVLRIRRTTTSTPPRPA